jgi:hypothetical protein
VRSGLTFEPDVADEQIDATTQAFLGITAACVRCHDHKFDPIPQADYYALAGIFRSTQTCYGTVRFINAQRTAPLLPLPKEANPAVAIPQQTDAERKRIEVQIKTVRDSMRRMRDPIQRFFATGRISLLQARLDAYDAEGNPKLLAMGGGVKGGLAHGTTDDHGFEAVEDKVHIHDWHATILHLLGLDHTRLTYRHAGRDMRLTDVKGNVAHAILG